MMEEASPFLMSSVDISRETIVDEKEDACGRLASEIRVSVRWFVIGKQLALADEAVL